MPAYRTGLGIIIKCGGYAGGWLPPADGVRRYPASATGAAAINWSMRPEPAVPEKQCPPGGPRPPGLPQHPARALTGEFAIAL